MTTPINTFQDILDAMERDPALLDALRRHILTDDLLELPAQFKALVETVAALTETVRVLSLKPSKFSPKTLMARMGGRSLSSLTDTKYESGRCANRRQAGKTPPSRQKSGCRCESQGRQRHSTPTGG